MVLYSPLHITGYDGTVSPEVMADKGVVVQSSSLWLRTGALRFRSIQLFFDHFFVSYNEELQ